MSTISSQENAMLIYNLEILQQEISIEGELQLASIARVMKHNIPNYIAKLRRLDTLERVDIPQMAEKIKRLEEQLYAAERDRESASA